MKKRLSLLVALALTVLVAPSLRAETLTVGSTPTGVPFTFLNTKTNQIDGMMIDLIQAIGKAEGFDVEVQPMAFATLIPALTSSKIDIIAAAMSTTPARAKIVDFSESVYGYGEGLVVPASDKKVYNSVADLKGYRVGAVLGTNYINQLQDSGNGIEVVSYDALSDIIRDIGAGRLQAGVGDLPILAYNFAHTSMPAVRLVTEYKPMTIGPINIAVRKDETALLAKINAAIAQFKQDGTLARILAKWNL